MPPEDTTPAPEHEGENHDAHDHGRSRIVLTDTTNLLDSAEPAGHVLCVLPSGTRGRITGGPVNSGNLQWLRISTRYGEGWVMSDWAVPDRSFEAPFARGTRLVTSTAVNLRESHDIATGIIYLIPSGSEVMVLDGPVANQGFDWYRIRSERYGTGWMVSAWLRVVE